MKQTPAMAEMLATKDCSLMRDRKEFDTRCRERMEGEIDRVRTRERLEATFAGLGELEYLRQRQELLVRNVLNRQESVTTTGEDKVYVVVEENYLNTEEKLLEENILLLRKQLNCLRKRDAGLINQLQELDRQISDLRLDTEASHEHVETDSRPSSGFYELSDGASGSLSNSSNSVFSECLSSCRSSTCFCSPLDTSLCASEGRPRSADELGICAECEGQCEEPSSGTVRRSLSAPYPPSPDGTSDSQAKYHCDLVAKNGGDVYRYPSPLHAVAVQSPIFFQALTGHPREDGAPAKPGDASADGPKPEQQPSVSQSTSWPASHAPPSKRLDGYIYGLLQRRAQPLRPSKPRTSINTDPSKSVLRQASLCARQAPGGPPQGWAPDQKPNRQVCSQGGAAASPQRQLSAEAKGEPPENGAPRFLSQPPNGYLINGDVNTNSLLKKKGSAAVRGQPLTATSKDLQDPGSPNAVSSPKLGKHPYFPAVDDRESPQAMKAGTPKKSPKAPAAAPRGKEERAGPELASLGSSSQSQDEGGQMVSARYIPAQRHAAKLRKGGGRNVKVVKVKGAASARARAHEAHIPEAGQERHRAGGDGSRKPRPAEDAAHAHRASRKASSSRARRIPAPIPEGRVLEKPNAVLTGRPPTGKHHTPGREAVLAKPRHKRSDYRRLRAIAEAPYDEAFRRAHRRQKRAMLSLAAAAAYLPAGLPLASPYARYAAASDSEYSAECASLFHSTVLDTSEDERSNYTTNCFGDSESSPSEADFAGESTTTSDSEASAGASWPQFGQAAAGPGVGAGSPQAMTSSQKAFVKIKASHNLKKKILRFRSGSLKLMTTV